MRARTASHKSRKEAGESAGMTGLSLQLDDRTESSYLSRSHLVFTKCFGGLFESVWSQMLAVLKSEAKFLRSNGREL